MESKVFFGFYVVKAYDYWWGYTSAQIDLMLADAPIVIYDNEEKVKTHSKREMEELSKRWMEKKKRGAKNGNTVNLNEFLKNK